MPVTKTRLDEDQLNLPASFDDILIVMNKAHDQNTDLGTSASSFYIGTDGPRIKNNINVFELRNNADTSYIDLIVNNLTVKGTTTTINSETLTIDDNIIILNSNYTGDTPIENAGVEVERGTQTNATILWDESNDLWKAGLAGSEKTIVAEGNTVTLTDGVTGSAAFDASGNINITATVVDDSHSHTIANITNLQSILDNKLDLLDFTAQNMLNELLTVDGDGSGLDADMLDGQHGSYYRDATNLNAGIISPDRLDGTYNISISGTAQHANTLTTARAIALSGDVTGSQQFDGSSNITIMASVVDDSHNHTSATITDLSTLLDTKLDTSEFTANTLLDMIKTVDGDGSGLDADLLQGQPASYYINASHVRTGRATIINKGVISGCTATKSGDIDRTVIISSGSAFAEGMIFPVDQTNVTVPENAFASAKYCYIYLSKTGTQWNPVCTDLDATVPTDGVPLYRLTVPANNTIVTDQYIANVTVTDNRRLEPNAPNAFSNSPFVLTSLSPVVANTNYIVNYDIASYTGSALQLGDIYIADKATNGFKIYLNGIADNVVINWAINGFNV